MPRIPMGTIDIEPTWETLCNMAKRGVLPAEQLMPACKIADTIRQAQKAGLSGVIVKFPGKTGAAVFTELK